MRKIRVLIVDDSVVIRRMLSDILAEVPEIEVAGTAPNGRIALAKLPQLAPDLMTLDVEMPELDGIGTLKELRKIYPKLPVIMFSTLTERGAAVTMEALSLGASDYVTKPANVGSAAQGMQRIREQLIPKIKALCSDPSPPVPAAQKLTRIPAAPRPVQQVKRFNLVAIGSSTGGPQALTKVLSSLPAGFPAPIVIVQHMPPVFTKHLADRLDQECELAVMEAAGDEVLEPGKVYIAPGDYHLSLVRHGVQVRTQLHQQPPENSCRPAVDVLFRSAAQIHGEHCMGVVLTGMGQDGLRGARSIVDAGGVMLAQDEATSVVWGMPRAVAQAGLAQQVLPLPAISNEILRLSALGRHRELVMGGLA